jgi:hypothetical protein
MGVPPDVLQGLTWLNNAPAPRLRNPEAWPQVVADALRLVSEGWAGQAMALGWTALDLFGAIAEIGGDPIGDGLAVRLGGRRMLAVCDDFATVETDNGGRSYIYRPDCPAARLLWKLGRRG